MTNHKSERGPAAKLLFLGSLLLCLLVSCAGGPKRDPMLAQDLMDYTQKMVEWEAVEKKALSAISKVERNQFVDDDYVAATLQEVIPDVRIHLERAARYQPRTQAVLKIHQRYLATWSGIAESFDTIIRSMEEHDYVSLSRGVERMRHSRQQLIQVAASISDLLDVTGVKPPPSHQAPGKLKFRKRKPVAAQQHSPGPA